MSNLHIADKEVPLISKAKSRQQIVEEYGISVRTLYRWFKRENMNISSRLTYPRDLRIIYKTFGTPENPKNA